MLIKGYTPSEVRQLFYENLAGLVSDNQIRGHMADVFTDFSHKRNIPVLGLSCVDSSLIIQMYENGKYAQLVMLGDAHMFICGWFYEWASKKRNHSLGIGYYVSKGVESYNYAVDLSKLRLRSRISVNVQPIVVSKLADRFRDNVCAVIDLRNRIKNESPYLERNLYSEMKEVLGYVGKLDERKVIQINNLPRIREKLIESQINEKMEKEESGHPIPLEDLLIIPKESTERPKSKPRLTLVKK